MKKIIYLILCFTFIFALTGCEKDEKTGSKTGNTAPGVNEVLEAQMAEADSKNAGDTSDPASPAVTEEEAEGSQANTADMRQSGLDENAYAPEEISEDVSKLSSEEGIDIDLTTLSSTMVYSEVYNMMLTPDAYVGKTIKMEGMFTSFYDENMDKTYFACIISDATACCSQGIEFVLTDKYTYPDDYPEEGGNICVVGVFDTYMEGDYLYCTLKNAEIV